MTILLVESGNAWLRWLCMGERLPSRYQVTQSLLDWRKVWVETVLPSLNIWEKTDIFMDINMCTLNVEYCLTLQLGSVFEMWVVDVIAMISHMKVHKYYYKTFTCLCYTSVCSTSISCFVADRETVVTGQVFSDWWLIGVIVAVVFFILIIVLIICCVKHHQGEDYYGKSCCHRFALVTVVTIAIATLLLWLLQSMRKSEGQDTILKQNLVIMDSVTTRDRKSILLSGVITSCSSSLIVYLVSIKMLSDYYFLSAVTLYC